MKLVLGWNLMRGYRGEAQHLFFFLHSIHLYTLHRFSRSSKEWKGKTRMRRIVSATKLKIQKIREQCERKKNSPRKKYIFILFSLFFCRCFISQKKNGERGTTSAHESWLWSLEKFAHDSFASALNLPRHDVSLRIKRKIWRKKSSII